MLINFVGSPSSGKTTLAAMLFSSMKETGMIAEFCPEQARFYIARRRVVEGLSPEDKISLTDEDQVNIMKEQVEIDEVLTKSCGDKVQVISDSSPLNAMLYMTPKFRETKEVQDLALRSLAIPTTTFHCHPIYRPYLEDPNRVHTEEQSKQIDKEIPYLTSRFPKLQLIPVTGNTSERLILVQYKIFF